MENPRTVHLRASRAGGPCQHDLDGESLDEAPLPYTSKYLLRRYLDPPTSPQSHLLRRYDSRPRSGSHSLCQGRWVWSVRVRVDGVTNGSRSMLLQETKMSARFADLRTFPSNHVLYLESVLFGKQEHHYFTDVGLAHAFTNHHHPLWPRTDEVIPS